jgi:hypothetical protein
VELYDVTELRPRTEVLRAADLAPRGCKRSLFNGAMRLSSQLSSLSHVLS